MSKQRILLNMTVIYIQILGIHIRMYKLKIHLHMVRVYYGVRICKLRIVYRVRIFMIHIRFWMRTIWLGVKHRYNIWRWHVRKKARVLVRKPFKGGYAYEWQIGTYIFHWKHDSNHAYRQGTHIWNFRVMTDWHWRQG